MTYYDSLLNCDSRVVSYGDHLENMPEWHNEHIHYSVSLKDEMKNKYDDFEQNTFMNDIMESKHKAMENLIDNYISNLKQK